MACDSLACLSESGCVENVPDGVIGQVMTQTVTGPEWENPTPQGASNDALNLIVEGGDGLPYLSCDELGACSIDAFSDVNIDGPSLVNGQFLVYNGTVWINQDLAPYAALLPLDTLSDVNIDGGTLAAGQVLSYNGTVWLNLALCTQLGVCSIDNLGDVSAAAPVTGEVLLWTGATWASVAPQKIVANPGAALPLSTVVNSGTTENLLNSVITDQSQETNDIIPVIDANGVRAWNVRLVEAYALGPLTTVTANVETALPTPTVVRSTPAGMIGAGGFTVPVSGLYDVDVLVQSLAATTWSGNPLAMYIDALIMVNGNTFDRTRQLIHEGVTTIAMAVKNSWRLDLNLGDVVQPGVRHSNLNAGAGTTVDVAGQIQVKRVLGDN